MYGVFKRVGDFLLSLCGLILLFPLLLPVLRRRFSLHPVLLILENLTLLSLIFGYQ